MLSTYWLRFELLQVLHDHASCQTLHDVEHFALFGEAELCSRMEYRHIVLLNNEIWFRLSHRHQ